jgi:cupin superfamily acireductone dioxygenase involved in methionine salvage
MQNLDYEYFLQNMEDLYRTYGRKFVVIKDQHILGAYDTFNIALENALKTEEIGTFLIQECFASKEECVYHFQGNVIFTSA